MTDEEVLRKYAEMERIFGQLPSPIHYPKQFAYYVKLYKHFYEGVPNATNKN